MVCDFKLMLHPRAMRLMAARVSSLPRRRWYHASISTKASDPLRILFCGSDAFSCESLNALHREHVGNPGLVESLDVMVRPPKRTGRGLKQFREVPCKLLADSLGLTVHERDTFRGWSLPEGINLIIAVSFGLFVPPRILNSSRYGGLNVHPSLLPDLRGPAPIHWALLRGDERVGVSLQTLDIKSFDHGTILSQTPRPGLPVPPHAGLQELTNTLGALGAEMLVQGLRNGVHIPPLTDAGWMANELGERELTHAPKVTKADSHADWVAWKNSDFERRTRVLGSVWSHALNKKGEVKRVIFQDCELVAPSDVPKSNDMVTFVDEREPGTHTIPIAMDATGGCSYLKVHDGNWIRVQRMKVDGKAEQATSDGLKAFLADPALSSHD